VRTDPDELKELIELVDLQSYLEREGITYRPTIGSRGPQFNVRECPVCGSRDWKVYLNQETGLGNCFAGSHVDVARMADFPPNFNKFGFIRATMGVETHPAAVIERIKALARDAGWKRKRTVAVATKVDKGSPTLPPSLSLPIHGKNLAYLENRGIDLATANYFGLSYCHEGGFVYYLSDGLRRVQSYSRRVLIPIYDLDGKLVSFQGRDILGTQDPKYLFPPGYSSTGEFLYNGHNVIGTKRVVVGEGAFDVMAIKLALDRDPDLRDVVAVGTFGKHLSYGTPTSQVAKFEALKARGIEEVTIMWDGEVTATDDAIEAGKRLAGIGLRVRIALLPPEKDPNEVPPNVVREAFYKAVTLRSVSAIEVALARRAMNKAA
jgi:DNA primase